MSNAYEKTMREYDLLTIELEKVRSKNKIEMDAALKKADLTWEQYEENCREIIRQIIADRIVEMRKELQEANELLDLDFD